MNNNLNLTMLDIDSMVTKFLRDKQTGIVTLHKMYFKNSSDQLSYRALIEEMIEELKTGCITFVNKNSSLDGLDSYLFYIANAFCKKRATPFVKKIIEYVCPGCLFIGKQNLINYQKNFVCDFCEEEYKKSIDLKWLTFFETFKKHDKNGFRCPDCNRFIPQPLDLSTNIRCPYLDCCFFGETVNLKKMNHPSSSMIPEKLTLDLVRKDGKSIKDTIFSSDPDPFDLLDVKEELNNKIKIIAEVIDNQCNTIHWNSSNFTVKHKIFVYQAFKKILNKYPEEMVNYLLNNSRSGGFQHKIFQEYIFVIENNLPLVIKRKNDIYKIESLLDEELSLFDGLSTFEAIVNDKNQIKNNTKEFYIGGRKATYAKPYYIGKLLNIINSKTKEPLLHHVKEYSFSKIKMEGVSEGTPVTVSHLRVPPHYQMGGMVYVNRIRKKIIDRTLILLEKE